MIPTQPMAKIRPAAEVPAPRAPEAEKPLLRWKMVLSLIVFPPLLAVPATWFVDTYQGSPVKPPPAEALGFALEPEELEEEPADPAEEREIPGNLLSDLTGVFRQGASSPLVDLQTSEEEHAFGSIQAAASGPDGKGLTLFRKEGGTDGVEVFEVLDDGERSKGTISLQKVDGRWHVVGAGAVGSLRRAERQKERFSREEAVSDPKASLEDASEEKQGAAAEAPLKIRQAQE